MPYLSYTRNSDNFMEVLLRDPKRYLPIVEFIDNVTQGLSELGWGECELIMTEVSKVNRSAFCLGIRKGVTQALKADDSALKRDRLAPVLAFALKLNQDASAITQGDVQDVLDAGWSEQTVEDVVGLVAIQRLYNTIAAGLGFRALPEAVFAEMGEATVQQRGYLPMFRAFMEQTGP